MKSFIVITGAYLLFLISCTTDVTQSTESSSSIEIGQSSPEPKELSSSVEIVSSYESSSEAEINTSSAQSSNTLSSFEESSSDEGMAISSSSELLSSELSSVSSSEIDDGVYVPYNVAKGKTVLDESAGSTSGAYAAIDGFLTTRWESAHADNQSFIIDLGKEHAIDSIEIHWESAYAVQYDITGSLDGDEYNVEIHSEENKSSDAPDYVVLDEKSVVRYVQFLAKERVLIDGGKYGFSIFEFKLFANIPESELPPPFIVPTHGCKWDPGCAFESKEEFIDGMISEMTVEEKVGQMTQVHWNNLSAWDVANKGIGSIIHVGNALNGPIAEWNDNIKSFQEESLNSRMGIPLLVGVDAVHGQNVYSGATVFPHNIGMAATRNMELIKRAGEITAIEVAATGFNWTFSPCIAMPQNEQWGRVYEGFSEDLDLTVEATINAIQGLQGSDLSANTSIASTVKHFIAEGATAEGDEKGTTWESQADIIRKYLPPYTAAVNEGVAAVMTGFNNAYNDQGEMKNMHVNNMVLSILKGKLGFQGVVVTDYKQATAHGSVNVINNGIDIAMELDNYGQFMGDIIGAAYNGAVPMSRINDAVRRILTMKYNLGLFENPYPKTELVGLFGSAEHRAVARQAVRESMVLLKSTHDALPLDASEKIAVVGWHANSSGLQSGGWTMAWQGTHDNYDGATNIKDAIQKVAPNAEYSGGGCYDGMEADKVVVVVGEDPYAEMVGDAWSAGSMSLWMAGGHQDLINGCKDRGKKVITVMISGRALFVEDQIARSDAFIAAWLLGSEGDGVADFLFGIDGFTPVGKSPYSWPTNDNKLPLAQDDAEALYQFGHGLESY